MKKYILELTNDCNLFCDVCPRHHIDMQIGYMNLDTFESIVNCLPGDATVLPFWRGEATLHPQFTEMIKLLQNYEVVLATNGTKPDVVLDVLDFIAVVNVSIHNQKSFDGYLRITKASNGNKTKVISSVVNGETIFHQSDRTYLRHSDSGVWGKVQELINRPVQAGYCDRLSDTVIAWDGSYGRCCYVWDTNILMGEYPDIICKNCDQWMGGGKTL